MAIRKDLGIATAYGYAVSKGYTGTEEEFAELMASYASVGQMATQAAESASASATASAGSAAQSAQSATNAQTAAEGAVQAAEQELEGYVASANQKATEAAQSATNASNSATAASTSATNAAGSATDAGTEALKAEGMTLGKQNGVDVESDSPYYHANTKYYSEQTQDVYDQAVAVKDSIPADYTALSGEVNDLKADLNNLSLVTATSNDFEIGDIGFSYNGWAYSNRNSRIRTKQGTALHLYEGNTISVRDGEDAVFMVGWLNENGLYNYQTAWLSTFTCPTEADYVLLIRENPEATIQNVADVFNKITIESKINVNDIESIEKRLTLEGEKINLLNSVTSVCNLVESNFEIGNINISTSGWTYAARDSRVRTKEEYSISLKAGDIIGLFDYTDAKFYVGYCKDSDGKYGGAGWLTTDYVCPYDGEYVILLCHLTDRRLNAVSELFYLLKIVKASGDLTPEIERISGELDTINAKIEKISDKQGGSDQKYTLSEMANLVWKNGTSASRLITEDIDVSDYKAIKYVIPSGYQLGVRLKTIDKTQFKDTSWDTTNIGFRLLIGATYATLMMRKSDDSAITPEEVDDDFKFYMAGSKTYNYNQNVQTIGHRGCDDCSPENTIASFKKAAIERFVWVETDVRYTSDGVPVLMHDETINRTGRNADGSTITETINIAGITYEQALAYDFGIWKGASYAGQKIPTFDEFMHLCSIYGLKAIVELKGDSNNVTTERCKELCQIAIKNNMKNSVIWLSSMHQGRLAALEEIDPAVSFAWLTNLDQSHLTEAIGLKTATNHIYIDVGEAGATVANQTVIDNANLADVGVIIWSVNYENKFTERLVNIHGIKGITTDGGDAALGLLLASGQIS